MKKLLLSFVILLSSLTVFSQSDSLYPTLVKDWVYTRSYDLDTSTDFGKECMAFIYADALKRCDQFDNEFVLICNEYEWLYKVRYKPIWICRRMEWIEVVVDLYLMEMEIEYEDTKHMLDSVD